MGIIIGILLAIVGVLWWRHRHASFATGDDGGGDTLEMGSVGPGKSTDWSSTHYDVGNGGDALEMRAGHSNGATDWSSAVYNVAKSIRGGSSYEQPVPRRPDLSHGNVTYF